MIILFFIWSILSQELQNLKIFNQDTQRFYPRNCIVIAVTSWCPACKELLSNIKSFNNIKLLSQADDADKVRNLLQKNKIIVEVLEISNLPFHYIPIILKYDKAGIPKRLNNIP